MIAARLARATGARLQLIAVAPTMGTLSGRQAASGRFMPGATHTVLELEEEKLRSYLGQLLRRFQAEGVAVDAIVDRGDPAALIAQQADAADVDLLVFGTHGKAGTQAFWSHSVGARVLAKTSRPVLLVPVKP